MVLLKKTALKSNFTNKQIQILEVAETLFAEKGFDATSTRDIAKSAGVNVSMISYYFGSKEKLFEEIFKVRMKEMERVYLTENEVQNIIEKDFKTERLSLVRDIFLFSCFSSCNV